MTASLAPQPPSKNFRSKFAVALCRPYTIYDHLVAWLLCCWRMMGLNRMRICRFWCFAWSATFFEQTKWGIKIAKYNRCTSHMGPGCPNDIRLPRGCSGGGCQCTQVQQCRGGPSTLLRRKINLRRSQNSQETTQLRKRWQEVIINLIFIPFLVGGGGISLNLL